MLCLDPTIMTPIFIDIIEGQSAHFECQLQSSTQWIFDDNNNCKNNIITTDNKLSVVYADQCNSGVYFCTGSNSNGTKFIGRGTLVVV